MRRHSRGSWLLAGATAAAAAITLSTSACKSGSKTSSTSPSSSRGAGTTSTLSTRPTKPACDLLTNGEVGAVVGKAVTTEPPPGVSIPSDQRTCRWYLTDRTSSIEVVSMVASDRRYFDGIKALSPADRGSNKKVEPAVWYV